MKSILTVAMCIILGFFVVLAVRGQQYKPKTEGTPNAPGLRQMLLNTDPVKVFVIPVFIPVLVNTCPDQYNNVVNGDGNNIVNGSIIQK